MGDPFPPSHGNQSPIPHSQIVVDPTIPILYLRSKHHQSSDFRFRFPNPASKRTINVHFFKCVRFHLDLHNICTPNCHNFLIFNVQLIRAVRFSGPRLHKKLAFWVHAFFVQSVNFTLGVLYMQSIDLLFFYDVSSMDLFFPSLNLLAVVQNILINRIPLSYK